MNRRSFLASMAIAPLSVAATRYLGLQFPSARTVGNITPYSGSMWIYLWDFVDEGYGEVFRHLTENRLTGISLAAAYHMGKFLEPHNPKRRVVFPEDGTIYFKHNPKLYGRLQPKENSLVTAGHSLAEAKRAADRSAMTTRAWVVCCHNTRLGTRYPEISCEDCFGDKLVHNLCPSNEDVRRYTRGLVADIASLGVDAIELEALQFQGYTHGYHHEREGIELNPVSRFLLGLCFCPSCRKRAASAHIDLQPVQQFTRDALELFFNDPAKGAEKFPTLESFPPDVVNPMVEWRKSVVSSFLDELVESARGTKIRQLMSIDPNARNLVAVNAARSAKSTGGILALGYVKNGASLRDPLQELQATVGNSEITLGLQVGLPESGGRREFLEKMSSARELGINSFNYYNYGFIPLKNLAWIKEAANG